MHRLTSSSLSARIGVPSLLDRESDLRAISRICDVHLPSGSPLVIRCEIHRVFARSTAALQAREDEESRLALMLMFSSELDDFRLKSGKVWDRTTELQFLGAKLFLLGWSFPYQNQSSSTDVVHSKPPTSRHLILHEAMRVSIELIHTFCELEDSRNPSHPSNATEDALPPQVFQPKVDFFTLYYGLETLYLFLSHFPSPAPSDIDLAYNHIRSVHNILSRCAGKNEEHQWSRMANNIDLIDKWHSSGRRLPPEAAIRSRMGASLFYDAMQKMAVLKAEKGGRSYGSDLTQPLPDREKHRGRKAGYFVDGVEEEGPDPAGAAAGNTTAPGDVGIQEGPLDQTGLWPGWDESIWGWDLNFLDVSLYDIHSTNGDVWQPQEEPRLFA